MENPFTGSFHECVDSFLETAIDFRSKDKLTPIIVLVGSNEMRRELRNRLHFQAGGLLGLHTLTFKDLAARLAENELLACGKKTADPLFQKALLSRLLQERPKGYFKSVAAFAGTQSALIETFNDLQEAGWDTLPTEVLKTGKNDDKVTEIDWLFIEYLSELKKANLHTVPDIFKEATEKASSFFQNMKASELHVVGLYDVNPLQASLLNALEQHVSIYYYVPIVTIPSEWAQRVTKTNGSSKSQTVMSVPFAIYSCPSEWIEAKEIIREARRLCLSEKIPLHRMAVLLRHRDPYEDLFAEVCREANVPYRISGGEKPNASVTLRLLSRLLALLDLKEQQGGDQQLRLERGDVMAFLGATPLPYDHYGWPSKSECHREAWDAISRDAFIKRGKDWEVVLPEYIKRQLNLSKDEEREEYERRRAKRNAMIAQELRTAVDLLAKGLESIHAAKSYTIAVKKLEDLARTFILQDDWLNSALEALFSLRVLDEASLPFSLPIFITQATEALDGLREPTGKKFPDNLVILPLASARGLRFDVVFIPGCVEGQIPFVGRQDPILLDHERKRLNELDSSRELPLFSDRQNNERNLFDLACQSATKQIVFSFPRIDLATERQRMPSHYLFGLFGEALTEEAFYKRSDIVKRFDANRLCPDIPNDALSGDEKLLSWMNQLEKSHPFSSVHFLKLCSQSFGQAWRKQVHQWGSKDIGEYEGNCLDNEVKKQLDPRLGARKYFSISEIEDFALCPRSYLFKRLLKLERPDSPELSVALGHDRRGSLVHDLLAKFYKDKCLLSDAIDDLYSDSVRENRTGGGILDAVEKARLQSWTETMIQFSEKQTEGFTFVDAEMAFDEDMVCIDLGEGKTVSLKGRLDRIDRNDHGDVRVVDYKTGRMKNSITSKKLTDDNFNLGTTLQIPLYMLAWAVHCKAVSTDKIQAQYWFLKDSSGNIRPNAVSFTVLSEEMKLALIQILKGIVEDMAQGRFVPRSDVLESKVNNLCSYCDYGQICEPLSRKRVTWFDPGPDASTWISAIGRADLISQADEGGND